MEMTASVDFLPTGDLEALARAYARIAAAGEMSPPLLKWCHAMTVALTEALEARQEALAAMADDLDSDGNVGGLVEPGTDPLAADVERWRRDMRDGLLE